MELFFSQNIREDVIILDKNESNHCLNVLRYSIGDNISIIDGKGKLYKGIIKNIVKKECYVTIKKIIKNLDFKDYYIHIAIAGIKNHDRLEWFVEKSVELGIDEISILNTSRTLRKHIRIERLHKISITALKQTLKTKLPKINPIIDFKKFIVNSNKEIQFICHLQNKIKKTIFDYKKEILNSKSSCILIGPEGDFDTDEIKLALKYNFNPLCLGKSRLRTETAGVIACHLLNLMNTSSIK